MSDGQDRKWVKYIFCSKSNCIKTFQGKNDQTDNKSVSNYLSKENRLHKTHNYTLMKKYLVQKPYATCRTENVERKKLEYQMKMFYFPELLVFSARVTKISIKPVNNSPTSK